MNKVYKSIWNEQTGTYVAVAETTKTRGKLSGSSKALAMGAVLLASSGLHTTANAAYIVDGNAIITSLGGEGITCGATSSDSKNWTCQIPGQGGSFATIGGIEADSGPAAVTKAKEWLATNNLGDKAIALGDIDTIATGQGSVAIGAEAKATSNYAVAVGYGATGAGIAIGHGATGGAWNGSIAIGNNSKVESAGGTSIGEDSLARGERSVAIGSDAKATAHSSVGIGWFANASGERSVAMGRSAKASGELTVSIGQASDATGDNSIAMGTVSKALGKYSISVGRRSVASDENSVALGMGAEAKHSGAVALGSGSVTNAAVGTSKITVNGKTYNFAGTSPKSTVSVGSKGSERTITNVAAGRISAESTDAINGSQLYGTNQALEKLTDSIVSNFGGDAKVEDGGITWTNIGGTGKDNIHNAIAASKTEVVQGDNIKVTSETGKDGQTIYTVATQPEVAFDKVTVGDVVINKGTNDVTGLSNTTWDPNVTYNAGRAATEEQLKLAVDGSKTHYYSANDGGTQGTNYDNKGAIAKNALAAGVSASATGVGSTAVGYSSSATGTNSISIGDSTATGSDAIALGRSANAAATSGVAIGYVARALGNNAVAIGRYSAAASNGIALGTNADANQDGSIAIGNAAYAGADAIHIGTSDKRGNDSNHTGAFRRGSTLIGDVSNSQGVYSTVVGSNNSLLVNQKGTLVGGFYGYGAFVAQGAFSNIFGSQNKIGKQDATDTKLYNNIAVTIAGSANEVQDSNGVFVSGYGNKVTNSYDDQVDLAGITEFNVEGVIRNGNTKLGQVGVIGAGNTLDKGNNTFLVGMHSTVSDAKLSSIQGFENTVSEVTEVSLSGANNTISKSTKVFAAGSDNTIANANNVIALGNSQTLGDATAGTGVSNSILLGDNIAFGTAEDGENAVAIGNDTKVANGAVAVGVTAQATLEGSVALGGGSVANRAAGLAGYVPTTASDADKAAIEATIAKNAAVDVGSRQITSVAAGTEDSDAVNVSQLKAVEGLAKGVADSPLSFLGDIGEKVERKLGETVNFVGGATNEADLTDGNIGVVANGADKLTIKLNKDINLGDKGSIIIGDTNITNNNVTTNTFNAGDNFYVDNSGVYYDGPITKGDHITNKDYVDNSIGDAITNINTTIENGKYKGLNVADGKGNEGVIKPDDVLKIVGSGSTDVSFDANSNTYTIHSVGSGSGNGDMNSWNVVSVDADGKSTTTAITDGKNVTFAGDSNVTVKTEGTGDGAKVSVGLADKIKVEEVTATTVNATTIKAGNTIVNNSGVSFVNDAGEQVGPSITPEGINAGGTTITNVAPGVNATDAVNVSQLNQVSGNLNNKISRVEKRADAGTAAALAAAGLPQAFLPGKSVFAVAGSTFEGEGGYAVGLSTVSDNGRWILKGSVAGSGRGQVGATAGVGYQW